MTNRRAVAHPSPPPGLLTRADTIGLSALRHHAPLAQDITRGLPLARDPRIRPIPFQPSDRVRIDDALHLDRRLPQTEALDAMERRIDDAVFGPPASMGNIALVVPLLFARASARPEEHPMRVGLMLEMLAFERDENPFTLDMLVVAAIENIRTSRFIPDTSEVLAGLSKARRNVAELAEALPNLIETRATVDDLLIAAGLRSERVVPDYLPWDGPALPRSRSRKATDDQRQTDGGA
jgi:hypothetical protein